MLLSGLLLAIKLLPPTTDMVYRQPQLASTGDMVGVAFGAGGDIFYSYSDNDGETFSKPSKVGVKGKLALGRHRGPRIVYQSGNVVISAIVGQKGGGQDGDLMAFRSDDNGQSWKEPVRINDVPGSAREGLHAMTSGNGAVIVSWLDLREKGTRLYSARSNDGGATWSKNVLIYESPDGHICECCHPSLTMTAFGRVTAMWRNSLGGNRDMYVAESDDTGRVWKPAKRLGTESWKLNACPMDGGALTISSSGKVMGVWRRENKILYSTPGGGERQLGEGKDPAIVAGMNEALYAVWTGADGSVQGMTSKTNKVEQLAPKGGYPQLLFTGRRVLAFWEEGDGIAMGVLEEPAPLASPASR